MVVHLLHIRLQRTGHHTFCLFTVLTRAILYNLSRSCLLYTSYSRKNNPAVEFMKKVIENKKALKLEENDYYQYQKYEKLQMSLNDVTPDKMEKGIYKKFSFFKDQVEVSPKTNKMILPISIKETASKTIFRKSPKSEKTIIEGMNSTWLLYTSRCV